MNWFRDNPFWGVFIAIVGSAVLVALGLLWWTKSSFEDAMTRYRESAAEQTRLESGDPYPSQANVAKRVTADGSRRPRRTEDHNAWRRHGDLIVRRLPA